MSGRYAVVDDPSELAHLFAAIGVLALLAVPGVYFGLKVGDKRPLTSDCIGVRNRRLSSAYYGAAGGLIFVAGLLVAISILHVSGFK